MAFLVAVGSGDAAQLERLLSDDVVLVSDGGAHQHAARRPVVGPERVSRFLANLGRRGADVSAAMEMVEANGERAVFLRYVTGPMVLLVPTIAGGRITAFSVVSNPDKLGPLLRIVGDA